MLEVCPLELPGVVEIRLERFGDERGFFSEVWNEEKMRKAGIDVHFVQDNHSYSAVKGVLRGLHFQIPPAAQKKLIRVSRGSIFDVAVDIRRQSPTFGKWTSVVVSSDKWNQVLIPDGFAHGFLALEDHCEVQYKVDSPYRPDLERIIRFDDPQIGIDWPMSDSAITLSPKDQAAPLLAEIETGF
jgi:dTDP-4-dehydrorhamnose 3,5-epimerase